MAHNDMTLHMHNLILFNFNNIVQINPLKVIVLYKYMRLIMLILNFDYMKHNTTYVYLYQWLSDAHWKLHLLLDVGVLIINTHLYNTFNYYIWNYQINSQQVIHIGKASIWRHDLKSD